MHQSPLLAYFDNKLQSRLHKPYERARERVIGALYGAVIGVPADEWDEQQRHADKTAAKLCECGRYAAVFTDGEAGSVVVSQARCKSRLCPRCNAIRSSIVAKSIEEKLSHVDSPRMLTLTLKSSDDPLADQLKHLQDSYRRLRRSKAWKAKVLGGIAVMEITYNPNRKQWHPHFHIVIDGKYWRQADIADAWEVASDGSRIVDIRMIHKRSAAARYVAKYVAKIGDTEKLPDERIPELAQALHGLRLVQTCGILHGSTREKPEPPTREPLQYVAPLGPLADAAHSGDRRAARILRSVQLATRLPRATDTGKLALADQRRSRKAIKRLRDWWDHPKEYAPDGYHPRPKPPPRDARPRNRALRLWQEPEHPPSALACGR